MASPNNQGSSTCAENIASTSSSVRIPSLASSRAEVNIQSGDIHSRWEVQRMMRRRLMREKWTTDTSHKHVTLELPGLGHLYQLP